MFVLQNIGERSISYGKIYKRNLNTCITGIGNPEPKYASTRHNAGLAMLDLLKDHLVGTDHQVSYKNCSNGGAKYLSISPDLVLIRSDCAFINLSGQTVLPIWKKLPNRDSVKHIVVHDELSLPLGKVQLRKPGTSLRGHNGLKSISSHFGSANFYRLAVGIGRPHDRDPAVVSNYVLGKFTHEELSILRTESFKKALEQLKNSI